MWFDFNNIVVDGVRGSGRKTIIKGLCNEYGLTYVPISYKVDGIRELSNLYFSIDKGLCLVVEEASKMSLQATNSLLKILESNSRGHKIILVYDNYYDIMPTILSRCTYYKVFCESLDLQECIKNKFERCEKGFEIVSSICSTFNEVNTLYENKDTLEDTLDLCNKIVDNVDKVSLSNFLKIYTYFDRLDFGTFLIIMKEVCKVKGLYKVVKITNDTIHMLEDKVLPPSILINEWLREVYECANK